MKKIKLIPGVACGAALGIALYACTPTNDVTPETVSSEMTVDIAGVVKEKYLSDWVTVDTGSDYTLERMTVGHAGLRRGVVALGIRAGKIGPTNYRRCSNEITDLLSCCQFKLFFGDELQRERSAVSLRGGHLDVRACD